MEFYSVKAMFGHVGRNNYIPKTVAVKAKNGREAAKYVRWMGRVKHNRKDAILDVNRITYEEYLAIKETMRNDPYFHVGSKQEQSELCKDIESQIISIKTVSTFKSSAKRKEKIKFKMRKNKLINLDALMQMQNYEQVLVY